MGTPTLHDARQGFKFTNQTENKSKKTIDWYDDHLERFEMFLLGRSLNQERLAGSSLLTAITTEDIRQFIAHLQGRQVVFENHPSRKPEARALSPYTIKGVVATLSAFFGWAVEEGMIARDPMDRISRPKVPKTIKERFSEEDVHKLLDACKEFPEHIAARNRAIILFLLDTGVRASELCSLTIARLDLDHGRAQVTGKGMRDRDVFVGKNTRKNLWSYLMVHRPQTTSPYLFVTKGGDKLEPLHLSRLLRQIGERAGVAKVHPHRFRHTAARMFIRNGGDAFALQRLLGHQGLETTRLYVELEREDVERAHERASPVDRWGLK